MEGCGEADPRSLIIRQAIDVASMRIAPSGGTFELFVCEPGDSRDFSGSDITC
jgi:hypothetical protein